MAMVVRIPSPIRTVSAVAAAVVAPVALTVAILPFRSQVSTATVALCLAVLVSLLAAVGTRVTAVIAAVSAALCFDIAFTEPFGSLTISHPQDVETTVLLLMGGLIVGQLSARNRWPPEPERTRLCSPSDMSCRACSACAAADSKPRSQMGQARSFS